jgi:PAS domain S-box-containing protein
MDDSDQKVTGKLSAGSGDGPRRDPRLNGTFSGMGFVRNVFFLSCALCTHLLIVEILGDTVGMSPLLYWLWRFVPYCLFLVVVAYYARPVARLDKKTLFMVLFLFSIFLTFLVGLAGRLDLFAGISMLRPDSKGREAIFSYLRLVSIFSFLAGSYFSLKEIDQTKAELTEKIEKQNDTEQALKRQLGFDDLIAGLLGRLAWSSSVEIDARVQTGLGQIAEFMGAEQAFVVLVASDSKSWSVSHEWCAAGIPKMAGGYQNIPVGGIASWPEEKLTAGEVVRIDRLDDYPPEALYLRQRLESEGVKSSILVPLALQGKSLIGCIGLRCYTHEQRWLPEDIRKLRLVAESFVNVVKRKEAEQSLRESEIRERQLNERFNLAADSAGIGVWDLDLVRNMLVWDERMHRLYQIPPERFSGEYEAWEKTVHPTDRPTILEAVQRAITNLRPFDTEFRIVWPGGEIRHIKAFARVIADEHGFPARMTGINYDITERKRAEEDLRSSEERFAKAFHASPEPISIYRHRDGTLLEVNERWVSTYGHAREEAIGRTSVELNLVAPEARLKLRHLLEKKGSVREYEIDIRDKQGDIRNVSLSAEHILIRDEPCDIYLHRDITEYKRAEAQLIATTEQLRALTASVNMAREAEGIRIAREIHDELGSALTGLRWDLEDIDRIVSESEPKNRLQTGRAKIAAMLRLTDTTIGVVRRISSELRPTVLDDLGLREAIEWHAQQFQAQRGITCTCESETESIRLDSRESTAVFRIFQEALTNILRHAQATRVDILMREEDGEFTLTIADNGTGIKEEQKTGLHSLGILGMRERAHLVGGQIELTGIEGKGTVLTVRIPEQAESGESYDQ